jgi:hypothetical protein
MHGTSDKGMQHLGQETVNVQMCVRGTAYESSEWIDVAQNRV